MSEEEAIERVDRPVTTARLVDDLQEFDLDGETVIVHSSFSALGWVAVDPTAVVDAFRTVVTDEGTIVMPTHSSQFSDPAQWSNPPVPDAWIEPIIAERAPFRPASTPSRGVGVIPECFRAYPDVHRSRHPVVSFAAWGGDAQSIVADHPYDAGLGEGSPLSAVYDREGVVVLLGVDHGVNTSLHLAEHRATYPGKDSHHYPVPVCEDGERTRVDIGELETDTDDFPEVGAAFEANAAVRTGTVGAASATVMEQRALVDFAVDWFESNR